MCLTFTTYLLQSTCQGTNYLRLPCWSWSWLLGLSGAVWLLNYPSRFHSISRWHFWMFFGSSEMAVSSYHVCVVYPQGESSHFWCHDLECPLPGYHSPNLPSQGHRNQALEQDCWVSSSRIQKRLQFRTLCVYVGNVPLRISTLSNSLVKR